MLLRWPIVDLTCHCNLPAVQAKLSFVCRCGRDRLLLFSYDTMIFLECYTPWYIRLRHFLSCILMGCSNKYTGTPNGWGAPVVIPPHFGWGSATQSLKPARPHCVAANREIFMVCTLIDHSPKPISTREFKQLMKKSLIPYSSTFLYIPVSGGIFESKQT